MNREELPCYGEIVTLDFYKLRSLDFQPTVIFDIGANLGLFTTFAHELFPYSWIVAIEPHPANFAFLYENTPKADNIVRLNKALGSGQVLRYPDVQGTEESPLVTGETYITAMPGYNLPKVGEHPMFPVDTEAVMLDELYWDYVVPGQKTIVKIDCEGAENVLFAHEPSMAALRQAEFITMELHPYWATREYGKWAEGQQEETDEELASRVTAMLEDTHDCISEPPMFYARRRHAE